MGKLQQQQQQQQDAVYSGHNEPRAFLPLLGLPFPSFAREPQQTTDRQVR